MIRKKQFRGGEGRGSAAKYYTDHLSSSVYYVNKVGLLKGGAFEHLGLEKREVDLDVFKALERNEHPETGERITLRTNKGEDRRTGMDLAFKVPKTLSMLIAENPGMLAEELKKLCVESWDVGMDLAESLAMTRERKGGAQGSRVTGNLLYLRVIHDDARPVGSNVPDPDFHGHHYLWNMTYCDVQECMKAADLVNVVKHLDLIDAVVLAHIERGLTKLGIGTERTADGRSFEISSVKGKEIFCKRHNQIRQEEAREIDRIDALTAARIRKARQSGKTLDYEVTRAQVKNDLGKSSAQKKKRHSLEEKLSGLRAQMTPEIRASMTLEAALSAPRSNWRSPEQARVEVVYTAFKKDSVVHELAIAGQLLRATGGAMHLEDALAFARSSAFIKMDGEGRVTTEFVQSEDVRTRRMTREGWDIYDPMVRDPERAILDPQVANAPDQVACTRFIWRSRDLVADISGVAGSGKSKMLREVVPVLRAEGHSVFLLAPTSESEKNLKSDFPDAMTFQQFQSDIERGILDLEPGGVICLDEASMVSMPQGHWIVNLVKDKSCRLVTLGDVSQYSSVERGDFLRVLQDSGSVRSEELTTTYRAQVGYLRDTYYDLKSGDAERRDTAFNRQDEHGDMREFEDWDAGREDALETYLAAIKGGQTAIMASCIHAEARSTAAVAREMLKSDEMIGEEDYTLKRLERLDADGVELRDTRHYQTDRVVKFHTKVRGGFNPGEKWRVVEQLDNGTCLLERGQVQKTFDPKTKGEWSIYDVHEMLVSIGERVRIPEGFKEGGVVFKNGDLPQIAAIDSNRVTFEDGRSVANDFLHVDQAHCVTGYSTECRTVDIYIGLAPMTALGPLTATDVYVGTTRARQKSIWYTDNKEEFREAALRDEERKSPYDFEQVATQAPAVTKDVEKIKAVDLQSGKRVGEKERTKDAKAYAAMQQAQMNQHVEGRGIER